jgi:hypothetical protein
MKNPEDRKAPCGNCKRPLLAGLTQPGQLTWRSCCGTWTIDAAGKLARPATRLS